MKIGAIRNVITGELKELTLDEFLGQFADKETQETIKRCIANANSPEAVVCFEHQDLGLIARKGLGRAALIVGPNNTYKLEDMNHAHLGDLPSCFKYPVSFARLIKTEKV